jgi:hypothetical protein
MVSRIILTAKASAELVEVRKEHKEKILQYSKNKNVMFWSVGWTQIIPCGFQKRTNMYLRTCFTADAPRVEAWVDLAGLGQRQLSR